MKRQSDDAVSQDKGFIEEEAAAPEIDEAENAPEEAADENTENKTIYDDASDYKFLKSRASVSHHSSGTHHHSSSGHHHHHHHRRRKKKMKKWKKVLIIVVSVILVIALSICVTLQILYLNGRSDFFDVNLNMVVPETVQAEVQDNGDYIMYKGVTYKYNHDVTNILFMGVDKRSIDDETAQGTGGQADAIVMIAMNVKDHKMTLLAVPRDTITDVALYSPSGHYSGMKEMQVCMAYAYGDGKEISCENTVSSVRRIFYNVPVNTYYALDLDGIAAVNDSVGGVDVASPETIGPFTEGESYHLEGKLSENFVRLRDKSGVDSSMKRLERQKIYAKGFLSTMTKKLKGDITSAITVYNESSPYSCTNLNAAKVTYLAAEFMFGGGMDTELLTMPGELSYDNQYARFNIDEEKFFEQFLSVYYERM